MNRLEYIAHHGTPEQIIAEVGEVLDEQENLKDMVRALGHNLRHVQALAKAGDLNAILDFVNKVLGE